MGKAQSCTSFRFKLLVGAVCDVSSEEEVVTGHSVAVVLGNHLLLSEYSHHAIKCLQNRGKFLIVEETHFKSTWRNAFCSYWMQGLAICLGAYWLERYSTTDKLAVNFLNWLDSSVYSTCCVPRNYFQNHCNLFQCSIWILIFRNIEEALKRLN